MDIRHAVHPAQAEALDSDGLRQHFLIENVFEEGRITASYTHYDRMMVLGIAPAGTPLTPGAELAKLPHNRVPERADWARLSSAWTRRVDQRIAELERLKAGLTQCIGCGCLSLQQCQLDNPGDRSARAGSGPRFWIRDS